jgi:hypothetical protein
MDLHRANECYPTDGWHSLAQCWINVWQPINCLGCILLIDKLVHLLFHKTICWLAEKSKTYVGPMFIILPLADILCANVGLMCVSAVFGGWHTLVHTCSTYVSQHFYRICLVVRHTLDLLGNIYWQNLFSWQTGVEPTVTQCKLPYQVLASAPSLITLSVQLVTSTKRIIFTYSGQIYVPYFWSLWPYSEHKSDI